MSDYTMSSGYLVVYYGGFAVFLEKVGSGSEMIPGVMGK